MCVLRASLTSGHASNLAKNDRSTMIGTSTGTPTTPSHQLQFRWWHFVIGALALIVLGLVLFVTLQPIQVLPRMTLAPGFSLTNQDGAKLTSEDLRGSLTLYNFTYTNCEGACPESGSSMATLQSALKSIDTQGIPVRLVTISFDPERDTPEVMAQWAESHGADPAVWTVATTDPARLKNIIGAGFSTYYDQNDDGSFTFDPTFVLVDGNGIIRTRYRFSAPDPATFERDLQLVTKEVMNGSGVAKIGYEAAHLFLCYPK
jgi:protein SCO1/2